VDALFAFRPFSNALHEACGVLQFGACYRNKQPFCFCGKEKHKWHTHHTALMIMREMKYQYCDHQDLVKKHEQIEDSLEN
jgi:hypothetical protein